ncbi:hypothetical protein [Kordia sp.]|uniref:hypothetical protein n=1 Tax=Kordia sp. TaxID=1965332 RepID=UPI003D6A8180
MKSKHILKIALCIGCFFFITNSFAQKKTINYYPYAMYWVNFDAKKPNHLNSVQVMFIGSIKSTKCSENGRYGWQSGIGHQFREHVEAYYKSKLGVYSKRAKDAGGYWRFGAIQDLPGVRARMAKRYPRVVFVNDFTFYCK